MNLKEKMILSLEQEDLSAEHKEYIRAVVNYIDNAIASRMQGDNISIGTYNNEMLEIAKQIKQGKTGDLNIDEMGEVPLYVENYIATISENGGMYKYVSQTYKKDISSGEITTRPVEEEKSTEKLSKEEMKTKLLSSLEQEDLSAEHKEYIRAVVNYIDNAIASRMQGDNISIGTYNNEMLEIAKQIKQGKTGDLNIDEMGEVPPYVENYIATISENGGMYKYVSQTYKKDISSGEIPSQSVEEESQHIIHIDESKFAQIYGKAKGRIKEVFSKIKSFLNIKSNDRNDKTNDENIK